MGEPERVIDQKTIKNRLEYLASNDAKWIREMMIKKICNPDLAFYFILLSKGFSRLPSGQPRGAHPHGAGDDACARAVSTFYRLRRARATGFRTSRSLSTLSAASPFREKREESASAGALSFGG